MFAVGVHLAPQAELEALQALGDQRLQARELGDVLVDARIVELAQRAQDLVELARIDVLAAQQSRAASCASPVHWRASPRS